MARSVTYSVVPRINPRDKEAAPKFYAQAQARGDVNIREMATILTAIAITLGTTSCIDLMQ